MPFLLIVLIPLALTVSETQRFSEGSQNRWFWMFGFHRREVRRLEC